MTKKRSSSEILFSVTIDDCQVDTFCTGGNGGQHRNAKKNGVRVTHPPSGAVGEHRDGREQYINKRLAFGKMVRSPAFELWRRAKKKELEGEASIEEKVDAAMAPEFLREEVIVDGKWTVNG